ncbi:MAG: tetratricopeptide repeat protein [Acidobacteriaceae bacterium]
MEDPSTVVGVSELPTIAPAWKPLPRNRNPHVSLLLFLFLVAFSVLPACAFQDDRPAGAELQQDYDAAQKAQSEGNLPQAAMDSRLFLVRALDLLATNFTNVGDYGQATPLFDEGLLLDPGDLETRLDYAQESVAAGDLEKARQLAEEAVERAPREAAAHLALGRVLLLLKDDLEAQKQFEAAVALDPNYPDGLALARADLALKQEQEASTVFSEMLKGFGDTAQLHMDIGLQYAETDHSEQAAEEFKKAIAENDKLPGAHYSLGAAYLQNMGEMNFPKAAAEFRKELEISPNDVLSHSQLGYIAMKQHNFPEAEKELLRAGELAPQDPDIDFMLGQLYLEMNQPVKAEAALRRSIELTSDVSRNNYQVQRAHYLLARVLMEEGKIDEAKKQLELSNGLLQHLYDAKQGKPAGPAHGEAPVQLPVNNKAGPAAIDPRELQRAVAVRDKIAPAIANSYNNLGVIAAIDKDYSSATIYFQDTAKWAPGLEGLDLNWGRAAFLGGQYEQAIPPLKRYVESHPADEDARSMLVECLDRKRQAGQNHRQGSSK